MEDVCRLHRTQLVDSTSGHELLTLMDNFLGYNQIRMSEED